MSTKRKGLTKVQLDKMRALLLGRRHRLLDEAHGRFDAAETADDDRTGDEGDLASLSLRSDLEVDARARESRELQLIEGALAKIQDGSYGTCEDCAAAISVPRLEALPFAQFCIDCQEKNEIEGASLERREFQVLD